MLPRSPGPSSTTRGAPESRTASPGFTPLVSSYTWMTVLSPMIWMTSPRSCSSPTNWTSYIRGRSPVAVTTGPATRKISPVPFPATRFSLCFTAMFRAPCSNHLYRSTAASSISDHQEFSDDFRGQSALLPPGDDPQVLDLAVLPHNVIEDDEDGERVHVGVPTRLQEMEFLNRSDQLPHAEGLEVFEPGGKVLRERVVAEPGREAVHVQRHHLDELRLQNLEASSDEGVVGHGGLRGPQPQKGFQIHDIDLAADEFPHEPGALRPLGDDGEEVLVIQFRDEVFPLVPPLDLGRLLAKGLQGLSMDRPIELVEHLVQGRQIDEALEEGFPHAPRGDDVFQNLRRGCAEDLAADDRLHVLHVEPVQVPTDHLSQLALGELDDLRVHGREVPTRRELDQVDSGRLRCERQDLRLVAPFAQDAGDLWHFHLEHPFVYVRQEERRLLRPDARGDVRIVPALYRDPASHAPPVSSEFGRERGRHWGGHKTSATSLIESRQISARMFSNRRSIRRVPSALSITTPPTQSIVPAKLLPTIDRTLSASCAFQYTFPFRHSSSCARRRAWTRPSLSARWDSLSRTAA